MTNEDGLLPLDSRGWVSTGARCLASPHADARPEGCLPDLLVVHNISLPAGQFGGPYIEDLMMGRLDCDAHPSFSDLAGLRVSSHFLIRRSGELVQFVGIDDRAWHAGVSEFMGRTRCNDFSIGVELEGCDDQPFEAAQMVMLARLSASLQRRAPSLRFIAGHSDIAPGRKTDPGPWFDWADLTTRLAGLSCSLERPITDKLRR